MIFKGPLHLSELQRASLQGSRAGTFTAYFSYNSFFFFLWKACKEQATQLLLKNLKIPKYLPVMQQKTQCSNNTAGLLFYELPTVNAHARFGKLDLQRKRTGLAVKFWAKIFQLLTLNCVGALSSH